MELVEEGMTGKKRVLYTSLQLLYSRNLVAMHHALPSFRLKPKKIAFSGFECYKMSWRPTIYSPCAFTVCQVQVRITINLCPNTVNNYFSTFQETHTCKSLLLLEKLDTICKVSHPALVRRATVTFLHKALTFYCRHPGSK